MTRRIVMQCKRKEELVRMTPHTNPTLIDQEYAYIGDGPGRAVTLKSDVHVWPEPGSLYIDADTWSNDLLAELNGYASRKAYRVDGEYVFSKKQSAKDNYGMHQIAYVVNDVEVGWLARERYYKKIKGRWGYETEENFRLCMRMDSNLHEVVEKRMLSDIGAPVKKIALQCHRDMVWSNRSRLNAVSIDYIISEEENAYVRSRVEDAGLTVNSARPTKVGNLQIEAIMCSDKLLSLDVERQYKTLSHISDRDRLKTPGAITAEDCGLTTSGVISPDQARSLFAQLQLALGPRMGHITTFDLRRGVPGYESSDYNEPMYPEEPKMTFTLKVLAVDLETALRVADDIRRCDAWRECWAMKLGHKLKGAV